MDFGERLKTLRKTRRLSQVELSKISGVSQQTISGIERGRNAPSEVSIKQLALALGCTTDELLFEDEKEKKPADDISRLKDEIIALLSQLSEDEQAQMMEYAEFLKSRRGK